MYKSVLICGALELVIRTNHSNWSLGAVLQTGHSNWLRTATSRLWRQAPKLASGAGSISNDRLEGMLQMTSSNDGFE